ncbi:MAG: class I SAM-dependent rRNA methyltransferase [Gammaproteobacteria bacterium]|nr:class I SAM-dependent rRNA methyltransferase [Gammaproteobacteria bacterium]
MNQFPLLMLKKREERRLLAGHLWVYSNEIDIRKTPLKNFTPGELVEIQSYSGKKLGLGYVNPHTLLCARLLTRDCHQTIDQQFFEQNILRALRLRESYFKKPYYRLIFGEADFLPGLVVDRFGDHFVVQITTAGMEHLKNFIRDALINILKPRSILWRNDVSIRQLEQIPLYIEEAYGKAPQLVSIEASHLKFDIPIHEGQKTGWFYDQQYNRSRLAFYVKKGQRVLDVFTYIGAWGLQAAYLGAKEVLCLDSSAQALKWLEQNAKINQLQSQVQTCKGDAFEVLEQFRRQKEHFDMIILDPPALMKSRKDLNQGLQAYQRLHELSFDLLKDSGLLFSTSCSMHLSRDQLLDIIRKTSIQTQTKISVVEQLHQAQDHPIHPAILETNYLKGFIVIKNQRFPSSISLSSEIASPLLTLSAK